MFDYNFTHTLWLSIPAAIALDLVLGDPQGRPHPVRWMGRAIEWFEPICRRFWKNESLAGGAFAAVLITAAWISTFLSISILNWIHPLAAVLGETVTIYYCLSIRALMDAAMEIHCLLAGGDIDTARRKLSWIVSRDVDHYQEENIARATVETVAENFVDGVLSPLFYAALGGAPLAAAYKMINTLDSMVGYKNERYRRFGKTAARIDDGANYLPARISVPLIALAARLLTGRHGHRALVTAVNEGRHHNSPNAGYPEAAFAGALAVRLNGPNYYHGQYVDKPTIGLAFGAVENRHIAQAVRLVVVSSLLGAFLVWTIRLAARWL